MLFRSFTVSRTTLYRYIDLGYLGITNKHLPQGKRTKKKHPQRQAARSAYRSIEQRDISRDDFGHWEMDTVIGKAKGKSSCALVLTERKARQEITVKLPTKTASNNVVHAVTNSGVFHAQNLDSGSLILEFHNKILLV